MVVELAVTAGPNAGTSYRSAEHSTFLVGRSAEAHIRLPETDPHVSRLHFLVEVNPPLCRLRHVSGTNPTLVNGARVTEADLRDGDRITAGVTEMVVRFHPPTPGAPTVALPAAYLPTVTDGGLGATGSFADDLEEALAAGPENTLPEELSPEIAGYRVGRVIGRGGMGVVYEAVRLDTGETVAVKTIRSRTRVTRVALTKFVREMDIVRRLDHPGVVRFEDSGVAGGRVWFAMEFVPGADAQATADAAGTLPVGRAVGWVVQALEALAHAHGKGYIHRDVKPSNLLVATGTEVVKLADFGLARAYEASPLSGLTLTGSAGGTAPFMPPEQVRDMRSVKPAADQYAAAATLYRLLAGEHVYPPSGTVQELFRRILETDPVPLATHRPDLPPGLTAAVHRALSRDAAARFPDCRGFAAAIRPFAG